MATAERMNARDKMRTIVSVKAKTPATIALKWSDGTRVTIDLGTTLLEKAFRGLSRAEAFESVRVGEWGHSIVWTTGAELGADTLWLETLSAKGHDGARTFLEWRLRHGLSLSATADALGLSRRMVAYYSNGEKPVPKPVLLACKGWEVERAA
jgi:hypothetical protein